MELAAVDEEPFNPDEKRVLISGDDALKTITVLSNIEAVRPTTLKNSGMCDSTE